MWSNSILTQKGCICFGISLGQKPKVAFSSLDDNWAKKILKCLFVKPFLQMWKHDTFWNSSCSKSSDYSLGKIPFFDVVRNLWDESFFYSLFQPRCTLDYIQNATNQNDWEYVCYFNGRNFPGRKFHTLRK